MIKRIAAIILWIAFFIFIFRSLPTFAKEEVHFSCKSGGWIEKCHKEVLRMGKHEVPEGYYVSAGNFILLNATCISSNTDFAFHAAFRVLYPVTDISIDYPNIKFTDDATIRKIGILFVKNENAIENYKNVLNTQYPQLVAYLEKVNAFKGINDYFVLSGEEMGKLINIPLCQ